MGLLHIEKVSDAHLEAVGVSKREFETIKKLLKFDSDIFIEKNHYKVNSLSPYTYTVDLSKYDKQKIP